MTQLPPDPGQNPANHDHPGAGARASTARSPFFDTPPQIEVGNALSLGWAALKRGYGPVLGAVIVVGLLQFLLGLVGSAVDRQIVGPNAIFTPVSALLNLLIFTPLSVGVFMVTARLARTGETRFDELWAGFRRYGPIVLLSLIIAIATWVLMLMLVLVAVPGFVSGTLVGAILGAASAVVWFVAMVYLSVRFWFATMICVDPLGPRPGPIDALALSWKLTSGRALTLFVIGVVLGLIVMVSMVLLILPAIFFGFPLAAAVAGMVYALLAHHTGLSPMGDYDACPHCGYSYQGSVSDVCVECGRERMAPLGG